MNPISPDLDRQIRRIVRDCGQQAEKMAAKGFDVSQKGPGDYVTNIDAALDAQLSAAFSELFPNDAVITEEDRRSRQQFHADYSRVWCIDPLDGTEDFIYGKRNYAVMVGLLENYQPIAGWVYSPTQDQMYFGGKDWGLFQASGDEEPTALPVQEPTLNNEDSLRLLIGTRDQKRYGDAIAQQIPGVEFYTIGSFGLKVLEVIMGRVGLYLYFNGRVKLWDTTGPLALANQAGVVCCSLDGEPIQFTPDVIHPETLAHEQSILIGWPPYIEKLRSKLVTAVQLTLQN